MGTPNRVLFLGILSALLPSVGIAAVEKLSIGKAVLGGSGCSSKNAEARITQNGDQAEIRLVFAEYAAKSGPGTSSLSRKNCAVSIPVQVPKGFQLKINRAEYRHKSSLPAGAEENITIEAHKGPASGQPFTKKINGPNEVVVKKYLSDVLQSRCGESFLFRLNTSVMVKNPSGKSEALGTFVSSALEEFQGGNSIWDGAAMVFKAELVPCSSGS